MLRIAPLQSNNPNTSRSDINLVSNRQINQNNTTLPISDQVPVLEDNFNQKKMEMLILSSLNLLANYILFLGLMMICINFELSFKITLIPFYLEELLSVLRLGQNIFSKK